MTPSVMTAERMTQHVVMTPSVMTAERMTLRDEGLQNRLNGLKNDLHVGEETLLAEVLEVKF